MKKTLENYPTPVKIRQVAPGIALVNIVNRDVQLGSLIDGPIKIKEIDHSFTVESHVIDVGDDKYSVTLALNNEQLAELHRRCSQLIKDKAYQGRYLAQVGYIRDAIEHHWG